MFVTTQSYGLENSRLRALLKSVSTSIWPKELAPLSNCARRWLFGSTSSTQMDMF